MEVTQTSTDGLKREFRIIVPADEVESRVTSRLDELGRTIRLPGFRPGKVPMQILRRRYGSSVRGEVLESTVQGSSAEAIREHNLRPALPPKVDIVSFDEGADLEYKMSLELLPDIPEPNFTDLGIERFVVEIPDEDTDRAIERIAEQQRKAEPVERGAAQGDILVVDIEGRVGEREIPGASGEGRQIALGAGGFVPGFEEQLIGAAAGERRTVRVTFPEDYAAADLAGKEAEFAVQVKEVRERAPPALDDALGRAVGLENLAELRREVAQQMQRDYEAASRLRLKRALLDKLAERYDFAVPPGMVEIEFDGIWAQHLAEKEGRAPQGQPDAPPGEGQPEEAPGEEPPPAELGTEAAAADRRRPDEAASGTAADAPSAPAADPGEEVARAEYRAIAERRVRLGLLLAEVGRSNNITVTQEELNQAITREARRHPGYERQVLDYYRQHPELLANLRAPIFEDKVVDFIVELAKPEERRVTPRELLALPDPDDGDASGEAPS
ncbi:MAG: trigger factor [Stellaceae bacterium]